MDLHAAVFQPIEQHALGRRHGVIVAIGGAREITGRAEEGTRDHAAHFMRTMQNLARCFANLVQLPKRNHFFMRGYLKNAIGRRVDDGRTGAHVLRAEFLNDLRARCGLVAERAAADARLEFAHDLGRKAVGVEREWLGEMNTRHFPVARGGVFAGRSQRAASECSRRRIGGRYAGERLDISQTEPREIGHIEAADARDVADGVACRIGCAKVRRIRHGADAGAIQHDPDHAAKHQFERNMCQFTSGASAAKPRRVIRRAELQSVCTWPQSPRARRTSYPAGGQKQCRRPHPIAEPQLRLGGSYSFATHMPQSRHRPIR